MLERDPDLLEHLESCRQKPFEGVVNRVVWVDKSPVQGSNGARGRWNVSCIAAILDKRSLVQDDQPVLVAG